jgi:hypothetical protein
LILMFVTTEKNRKKLKHIFAGRWSITVLVIMFSKLWIYLTFIYNRQWTVDKFQTCWIQIFKFILLFHHRYNIS